MVKLKIYTFIIFECVNEQDGVFLMKFNEKQTINNSITKYLIISSIQPSFRENKLQTIFYKVITILLLNNCNFIPTILEMM